MAFNSAFTITPTADASTFILTDSSTGSDGNLTGRTIYLIQTSGAYLVFPIPWPIGQSSITLNLLQQDIALNIRVDWSSSSPLPSPSTYTYSQIYAFVGYGQLYVYQLTQYQTSKPTVIDDSNYYSNKSKLITEIDSALSAIVTGADLYGAQSAIDRYQFLIKNSQYFF